MGNEYEEWKTALGSVAYIVYTKDAMADEVGNMTGGNVGINLLRLLILFLLYGRIKWWKVSLHSRKNQLLYKKK